MATQRREPASVAPADGPGEQLALSWAVPPATPATTDFLCWLWAAFPPKNGRLNISRIATALGISTTTLRRWIAKDEPKMQATQIRRLEQRAILRGKGHYLWPGLDPVTRRRSELIYADALRNDELIRTEPQRVAPPWRKNGTVDPHVVQVVYFPKAHVYGVSAATHDKAQAKVRRHGNVIESTTVDNKYAAVALKQEILRRVDEHRCITPRHLVPTGRTETWRETGGPATIRLPLEVSVVRFGGRLTSFAEITRTLREANPEPQTRISEHVVTNAQEAATALSGDADVVILTSHAYTQEKWNAARSWPGGSWYAGGRANGAPGMSLEDLMNGLEGPGLNCKVLVIDTCNAAVAGQALLDLASSSETRLLLKREGDSWGSEVADLNTLISQARENREDVDETVAGITRYFIAEANPAGG